MRAGFWPPINSITTATDPIRPEASYHPTAIDNWTQFTGYRQIECNAPAFSAG
jgi:hypothetical protein